MNTAKQSARTNPASTPPDSAGENARFLSAYSVDDGYKSWILLVIIAVALGGAVLALV